MPSPFPGMDPYLEDPAICSGVHASILGAIFERPGPAVRPKYAVPFEERVYVTGEDDPGYPSVVPDVRVFERGAGSWNPSPVPSGTIAEPIRFAVSAEVSVLPIRLQDQLPAIGIPLRDGDPDVPLDLQAALNAAVERGSYDLDTDYSADPVPPLTGAAVERSKCVVVEGRQQSR